MTGSDKRGLFKRLTDALFEDVVDKNKTAAAAEASSATTGAVARVRASRENAAHELFQSRIDELLASGKPAVAGKMQFLDLDLIKADLGDRWRDVADRVRAITERVIEKRLAPEDAFVPYDGESFLLLFANLSEAQARIKTMAIAQEIRQRLIGELELGERYWVRSFLSDLAAAAAAGSTALGDLDALLRGTTPIVTGKPAVAETATPDAAPVTAPATAGGPTPPGAEPARPAAPAPPSEKSARAIAAQAKFEARAHQVARQPAGKGSAGKLQLLQLEDVKRELGPRWSEIAGKVRSIAEQVLTHRLTAVDVYAPADEGSYVLLFAELDEDEARLKAAALAREIRDRILGELGPALKAQIEAYVAPIAEITRALAPAPATVAAIGSALARREDVAPPVDTAAQAELRQRLGEVSVNYRPMLFAPRSVISVFSAQALRLVPEQRIHRGLAAYPSNDPPVSFEIDRVVLLRSIRHLRDIVGRAERALVSVPIRMQSLIEHGSGLLVDLCRAQPPVVRHHLVIDVFGLWSEAPGARLGEAVALIAPFCRSVTVTVPPGSIDLERLARHGVKSVGIELQAPDHSALAPERLIPQLPGLARAAHGRGMTAHLHGIADPTVFAAAREAGFDFLDGPVVAKEIGRPVAMYPYAPVA